MVQKGGEEIDVTLLDLLTHILELTGRYINPTTYIKLLLPRVLVNVESATTFPVGCICSECSRIENVILLHAMVS